VTSSKYAFVVADDDWRKAERALFTEDGTENAGVFLCGVSDTGDTVRLLAREFIPVPIDEYKARLSYHLEVEPRFYNRVVTRCEESSLHPVIVHSHRIVGPANYSPSDDFGERHLLAVLQDLLPGKVVGSLVATQSMMNGRRLEQGRFIPMDRLTVIGLRFFVQSFHLNWGGANDRARYDRQIRAFGEDGQRALAQLIVGVVGLGGTGSIILEQLGRVGVGELVLVDNDSVDESNLSRVIGTSKRSVGARKTDVAAKSVAQYSSAKIRTISDSALKQSVLAQMRRCDLIFGCVDNDRTRATLNRFAYQYLVPFIDMGVRLDARMGKVSAAAGRVSVVGPGRTCLRCSHHLDTERILAESMPKGERDRLVKEGYVMGVDEPAPAVVSLNTIVAGLAATALLNLVVGITGGIQPDGQIYDGVSGSVFPISQVHESGCDVCDRSAGVRGLGDLQIVSAY
jgi:hypothetical protein